MRTLGKRVKGNLSRVQIPHPPLVSLASADSLIHSSSGSAGTNHHIQYSLAGTSSAPKYLLRVIGFFGYLPPMRRPWKKSSFPKFTGDSLISEMSDDLVEEYVTTLNKHHTRRISREIRHERRIQMRFERDYRRFLRSSNKFSFSSGSLLEHMSNSEEVARSRAYALLRNRHLQYSFGPLIIEYVVNSNHASSYYSMNQGLDFHFHLESELRGGFNDYITTVSKLLNATDEDLLNSIRSGKPLHYPEMVPSRFSAYSSSLH